MINLGIIGLGNMGMGHCLGFDRLSDCHVLAVADNDEKRLENSQNFFKKNTPRLFTDYRALLKMEELHAVIIATPTYFHKQITIDALRAKKDVFLEKPIAPTIEETDEIIEAVAKTDRILQIGLVYRYSNLYRTMAHLIEDKTFGNVMMAYCKEFRDNFPSPWFFDETKSGGAILDKNCHHFDLFSWFIQSLPKKVIALGGQHVIKSGHKINCSYSSHQGKTLEKPTIVDHANVLVEYENGAKANLGLCMYEIEPIEGLEIGIIGDNGAWALAKNDTRLDIAGGPIGMEREVKVDYYSDNEKVGHIGCQTERREFLDCVKLRTQPYANLAIGREACVISMAAERSIKEERAVYISEFLNPKIQQIFKELNYVTHPKTPNTFSLETSDLILKLKKELRIRERKLKRELDKIKEDIKNLSK
ncbi:MAG: Gfo/Idh/MocA family oxidoreductase [Promethearchaeota archaeon]|nr:MAG: Gfo/Idh/MocA family oxidoreductase [Candidatus Lokiarchaeota archaeon]